MAYIPFVRSDATAAQYPVIRARQFLGGSSQVVYPWSFLSATGDATSQAIASSSPLNFMSSIWDLGAVSRRLAHVERSRCSIVRLWDEHLFKRQWHSPSQPKIYAYPPMT